MTAKHPRVSVLMPVYNSSAFLGAAIDSVLTQTLRDFELVIKDDASSDASRDIAAAYARKDPRIVILPPNPTNRGEAAARTDLLDAARGDFIAWLDSDDVAAPERLETQVDFLVRHSEFDAVGTGIAFTDRNLNVLEHRTFPADPAIQADKPDICCAALMLRAQPAKRTGKFRDAFFAGACDGDWLMRFCDRYKVTNIEQVLYFYRQHAGSSSSDFAAARRLGVLALHATGERRAGRPDPIDTLVPDRTLRFLRDEVFLDHPGISAGEKLLALGLPLPNTNRLVSVLVPFQNHHHTLYDALLSLAVQSFRNFEVIVFDNGSTPALDEAEVNPASFGFPIRLLRSKRRLRGFQVCQALTDAARGLFLMWQRADVYSRNDRIQLLLTYLLDHPVCQAVGSGINVAHRNIHDIVSSLSFRANAVQDGRFDGAAHTVMLRHSAFEKARLFTDADLFPLDSAQFLTRIDPPEAVHNFHGYLVQVRPSLPQLDAPSLWPEWEIPLATAPNPGASTASMPGTTVLSQVKRRLLPERLRPSGSAPAIHRRPVVVRIISEWAGEADMLDRHLPGSTRRWKNIEFVVEEGRRADYHVFFNGPPRPFHLVAPPNRVWFTIGEPPTAAHKGMHRGTGRGTVVLTCDEELAGNPSSEPRRYIATHCMLPWSVGRTYDQIAFGASPEKSKALSWVTSDLRLLPGQRYRMQFLERLRASLPFDLFGRGFVPLDDKWDGLAPYRYSIAFENFSGPTYFSEKLTDCFAAETLPLYHGCTEIERYFPSGAIWRLDPEDRHITDRIRELIASDIWRERLAAIQEARYLMLTKYNMFITIAELIRADNTRPQAFREMHFNPSFADFQRIS